MGYQINFAPTNEKMEEYREYKLKVNTIIKKEAFERRIIAYCTDTTCRDSDNFSLRIRSVLCGLFDYIETEMKAETYDRWRPEKNHVIRFTGWDLVNNSYKPADKEELIERYLDKLFIIGYVVKTPDFFEERKKFDDRIFEITGLVTDFTADAEDFVRYMIVNDLKPFEVIPDGVVNTGK